jgi:catechol 2,3-dioxygenase-like lactoylglutathione lyase family enzyme
MIEVQAIDHVVLRTGKLDEMLAFYRDFLGCPLERQLDPEVGLVQLRAGSGLIDLVPVDSELGRLGGGPPQQDGRNVDHICLAISAVDKQALLSHLDGAGISHQGFAERYGARGFGPSVYINDPEGNVVELKLPPTEPV